MHSNEQMLTDCYTAFAVGNIGPMLESLAEDVRFEIAGGSPVAGSYLGKPGVLNFFGKMGEVYRGTLRAEVLNILADDRHGVVLTEESLEYAGRLLGFKSVHVWEIGDRKLLLLRPFYDEPYQEFWSKP